MKLNVTPELIIIYILRPWIMHTGRKVLTFPVITIILWIMDAAIIDIIPVSPLVLVFIYLGLGWCKPVHQPDMVTRSVLPKRSPIIFIMI